MNKFIVLMVIFLTIGCGVSNVNVTRENYKKIQNGMPAARVTEILGEPNTKSEINVPGTGKMEAWMFQLGTTAITVDILNGKVHGKTWIE
jgi:hypothetical protein